MSQNRPCYICQTDAQKWDTDRDGDNIECPRCGRYFISASIIHSISNQVGLYKVSGWIREYNDEIGKVPEITSENFQKLLEIRDKTIQEKFDLFMMYLSSLDEYAQVPSTTYQDVFVKCWIKSNQEFEALIGKVENEDFARLNMHRSTGGFSFTFNHMTFDGLQYLESIQTTNKNSKNIFAAFKFDDEISEIFNTHVKEAVEALGFNYVVVNQQTTPHDQKITDEIVSKIKSSRFIIADFTHGSPNVYFEAGYAMGMKIPVIWTCQKGHEFAFDTNHYSTPHVE